MNFGEVPVPRAAAARGGPARRTVIIGPWGRTEAGGVVQHMRNLLRLDALRDARVYDPGSLRRGDLPGAAAVALRCLRVARLAGIRNGDRVWINASMHPASMGKLLLLLLGLRSQRGARISVFLHGGDLKDIGYLRIRAVRAVFGAMLRPVRRVHVLVRRHVETFRRLFPDLASRVDMFLNYLPEDGSPCRTWPDGGGGRLRFLFVGRFVAEKGCDAVIGALRRLAATPAAGRIEVRMAGEGEDEAALRAAAAALPAGMLCILGRLTQKELAAVYVESAVLLLPSKSEGLPYVVLEALRFGLALLTTDAGRLEDLNVHGVNGLRVPFGDPAALAAAMLRFLDEPGLCAAMGRRNQAMFLRHFSKSAAEAYYAALQQD